MKRAAVETFTARPTFMPALAQASFRHYASRILDDATQPVLGFVSLLFYGAPEGCSTLHPRTSLSLPWRSLSQSGSTQAEYEISSTVQRQLSNTWTLQHQYHRAHHVDSRETVSEPFPLKF